MSENTHIEELIVRYFLDDITEEELRELESWMMDTPENKARFFELKRISDSSRRSIWSEADKEASWQRMYDRLGSSKVQTKIEKPFIPSPKFPLWIRYAAVVLITLSIGWGINELVPVAPVPEIASIEPVYNEIRIGKGSRGNTLILSDGSKVTLNAATTFRYPTNFTTDNRMVYLDGEAYFEVAKDEKKPFVVKLKKQDIKVLGTSFNVEAFGDESYSIVTLLSGSVSLESYNEEGEPMSKMFLKVNQRAISDNQSGSVSLENIDTSLAEAWTEGKYKFKDEPLAAIGKRLEKYYDVHVRIETESLKQLRFTGTFSLDQDIQEVLNVLDQEKRYKVRRIGKEISIVKR